MELDLSLYKMSKDYGQLKELLDQGKSVLVKRGGDIYLVKRVGKCYNPADGAYYQFAAGGFTCSPGLGERYFVEGCKSLELEFLPPTA